MLTTQFMAFAVIGAAGFAVDGGLMMAISSLSTLSPMEARPFSFAAAVTVTWWLNRTLTFSETRPGRVSEWARYAVVNGFGALVNVGVFYLMMLVFPSLRTQPLLVLAVAAVVALFANFFGSKRLVFGTRAASHSDNRPCRGNRNG